MGIALYEIAPLVLFIMNEENKKQDQSHEGTAVQFRELYRNTDLRFDTIFSIP